MGHYQAPARVVTPGFFWHAVAAGGIAAGGLLYQIVAKLVGQ